MLDYPFWKVVTGCVASAIIILVAVLGSSARGHDARMALSIEDQKVYEFYNGWMRPAGKYAGVGHRVSSCCNLTDCFPVVEIRLVSGRYGIKVQTPHGISREYVVDPQIIESNQPDPRESPDGKSHACIAGGMVICFVEGSGI